MKKLFENWRGYLNEESTIDRIKAGATSAIATAADVGRKAKDSSNTALTALRGATAEEWAELDKELKDLWCYKMFPDLLNDQGDIKTWGDLHNLLRCTIEYKDITNWIKVIVKLVPLLGQAIDWIRATNHAQDFFLASYQTPDDGRPAGNLGKLDLDDPVERMIASSVEHQFIKWFATYIFDEKNLDDEIPNNWNITAELKNYLEKKYDGRTIKGFPTATQEEITKK